MYISPAFSVTDSAKLDEVISSNSFGTLVSQDGGSMFASHLPFLYYPTEGRNGKLLCHVARANRHWQLFREKEEVLAIFQGPHAYISPRWYATEIAVPTWNYVTVHAYGYPKILEADADIDRILNATVDKHESGFADPRPLNIPDDMKANLKRGIVAFEIEITRLEGKFKLGQNRSQEDRAKMLNALQTSGDVESQRLAQVMEREFQEIAK